MRIKSSVACLTLFTAAAVATPVAMAQSSERDNSGFFISGSYGGYKAHGGEFEDENDENQFAREIREGLSDPASAKKAIVYAEIFNRKY